MDIVEIFIPILYCMIYAVPVAIIPCLVSFFVRKNILYSLIPGVPFLILAIGTHYAVASKPSVDWGSAAGSFFYITSYEVFILNTLVAISMNLLFRRTNRRIKA